MAEEQASEMVEEQASKMSEQQVKKARTLSGVVVSNKMDKTVSVQVTRRVKHPIYGKYVIKSTKVHAHDANRMNVGKVIWLLWPSTVLCRKPRVGRCSALMSALSRSKRRIADTRSHIRS